MKRRKIYIANNIGFSAMQRHTILPIISKLESMGFDCYEPFARNNAVTRPGGDLDYWAIGMRNYQDIVDCDAVMAVLNGEPPDVGAAWECGAARALEKPIFLLRDDFRICSDGGPYPVNLMFFAGYVLDRDEWKEYYYDSVANLDNPHKALYKYANRYADKGR